MTTIIAGTDGDPGDDVILSFETDETSVESGDSVNLTWVVSEEIISLTLDDGSGPIEVILILWILMVS